jgi:hypothetical protein
MTRILLRDLSPGTTYQIQLRSRYSGNVSDWSPIYTFNTNLDSVVPAVPTNVVWSSTGRSFLGTWNAPTADTNGVPLYNLGGYRIRVTHEATAKSVVYVINDIRFDFTYEMNEAAFGKARSPLSFEVQAISSTNANNNSAWSPAVVGQNPVPTAPVMLTPRTAIEMIEFPWSTAPDLDLVGYNVYASQTNGFTPGPTNLRSFTNGLQYSLVSPSTAPWYVHVRSVDIFGQESTSSQVSGTATPNIIADTTPPVNVTNVTTASGYDTTRQQAYIDTSWGASTSTDVRNYTIRYLVVGSSNFNYVTVNSDVLTVRLDVVAGTSYNIAVQAVDFTGNRSGWVNSATYPQSVPIDTTGPSQPAAPTAAGGVQQLFISHNGNRPAGSSPLALESDWDRLEIYASKNNNFTQYDSSTLLGTLQKSSVIAGNFASNSGIWYVKVIAVDISGNKSPASAQATATVAGIGTNDLDNSVNNTLNTSIKTVVTEYAVNSSETTAPTTGWSASQPTRTPGTFVWYRAVITYNNNTTSTSAAALLTGNTGTTGAQGTSVSSITPYFMLVATGAAAPAAPSANPPGGTWSATEPGYSANTELYRTERILFSNSTFQYTTPSKVSSYTASSTVTALVDTWKHPTDQTKIDGGDVYTGSITANQLAANAVTAGKLNVVMGGGNLLSNSHMSSLTNWNSNGSATLSIDSSMGYYGSPVNSLKMVATAAANPGASQSIAGLLPNTTYSYTSWVYNSTTNGMPAIHSTVQGGVTTLFGGQFGNSTSVKDKWVRLQTVFTTTATPGTVTIFTYYAGTVTAGKFFNTDAWQLEEGEIATAYAPKTDEILPGTVNANMMVTNTITAASGILADAVITEGKIGNLAVTNAKIADATITTAKIVSLTADKLTAGNGIIADLQIGNATNKGSIKSADYAAGVAGWKIGYDNTLPTGQKNLLEINEGLIRARTLQLQQGQNIIEPAYADFEFPATWYGNVLTTTNGMTSATAAMSATLAKYGVQSLAMTVSGPAAAYAEVQFKNSLGTVMKVPVESGKSYIVSMYVHSASGTVGNKALLAVLTDNIGGYYAPTSGGNQTIEANGTWIRKYWTHTVTNSNVTSLEVRPRIYLNGTATNETVYVDAIQVEEKIAGSDLPSGWTPPSSTTIDGGQVTTGKIKANYLDVDSLKAPLANIGVLTTDGIYAKDGVKVGGSNGLGTIDINSQTGYTARNALGVPTVLMPLDGSPRFIGRGEFEQALFTSGFETRGEAVGAPSGTIKMAASVPDPQTNPSVVHYGRLRSVQTMPALTGMTTTGWAATPSQRWAPLWNETTGKWWILSFWENPVSGQGAVTLDIYNTDGTIFSASNVLSTLDGMNGRSVLPGGAFFIGTQFVWGFTWINTAGLAYGRWFLANTSAPTTLVASTPPEQHRSGLARDEWNIYGSVWTTDGTDMWWAKVAGIAGDHSSGNTLSVTGIPKNSVYAFRYPISTTNTVLNVGNANHSMWGYYGFSNVADKLQIASINMSRTLGASAFDYAGVTNRTIGVVSLRGSQGFAYGQTHAAFTVNPTPNSVADYLGGWYGTRGGLGYNSSDGYFWGLTTSIPVAADPTTVALERQEHQKGGAYDLFYTWFDGNSTNGMHESALSPASSVSLFGRDRIQLSTAPRPAASNPTTTDDVTGARFYMRDTSAGSDITKVQGIPMVGADAAGQIIGNAGQVISGLIPEGFVYPGNVLANPAYSMTAPSRAPTTSSFVNSLVGVPFRIYSQMAGIDLRGSGIGTLGPISFNPTSATVGSITVSATSATVNDPLMPTDISNKRYADSMMPAGTIVNGIWVNAPTGFALLSGNGTVLNRAANPVLFASFGTTFNTGGEAATEFRLPSFRGRTMVTWDPNQLQFNSINSLGGAIDVNIPGHQHDMPLGSDGGTWYAWLDANNGPVYGSSVVSGRRSTISTGTVSSGALRYALTNTGGAHSFSVLQPYYTVNTAIRMG